MVKCGIVGLPNTGKSTLFNALTQANIEAANYPFCTIEPNVGVVPVPDLRLKELERIVNPQQVVPAIMQFVDIAGLVKGAALGEGLGNRFLANIREAQAIAHVVRCFDDPNIIHVHGKVDPKHDIGIINTELVLADMETVEKALAKTAKNSKSGNKEALFECQVLEKIKNHLDGDNLVLTLALTPDELVVANRLFLLTAKPMMYVANVQDGQEENPWVQEVREIAALHGAEVVTLCAATEAELMELNEDDRLEFMTELGLAEPGLHKVIRAGYDLLNLHTYFTAGVKEVRAWTIPKGATAPQAAGAIHTDFEKGFIRAEVISYEAFVQHQGEQGAKEAGKLRLEGKEYIVCDGDVMHFRFNV